MYHNKVLVLKFDILDRAVQPNCPQHLCTNSAKNLTILHHQDAHTSLILVPSPCGTEIDVVISFISVLNRIPTIHLIIMSLLIGRAPRQQSLFHEQVLVGVLSPMRSFWARHLAREAWASPQNMERQGARVLFLLAQDRSES